MKLTIAQARKLAGLTQVEMARRLGMALQTYTNIEKYRNYFRINDAYMFSRIVGYPFESIVFVPEQQKEE